MKNILALSGISIFFVLFSLGYAFGFSLDGASVSGNVTLTSEPDNKLPDNENPFEGKTAPIEGYVPPGLDNEPDLVDVFQTKTKPSLDYPGAATGNEIDENHDGGYVVNKDKKPLDVPKNLDVPKKIVAGGEKRVEEADGAEDSGEFMRVQETSPNDNSKVVDNVKIAGENGALNENDDENEGGKAENKQGFFSAIANWFKGDDSNGNFENGEKSDLKEDVNDNGERIETAENEERVNEEGREGGIGKEKESVEGKNNPNKKIEVEGKESDTGGKKQDSFLAGLVKWLKG